MRVVGVMFIMLVCAVALIMVGIYLTEKTDMKRFADLTYKMDNDMLTAAEEKEYYYLYYKFERQLPPPFR